MTVRLPRSHRELYERLARERGVSLSEYIVIKMAELHGLDLPTWNKESDDGQLPLSA